MYQLATTLTLLSLVLLTLCTQAKAETEGPWDLLQGEFTNYQQTIAEPEQGYLPIRYTLTRMNAMSSDTNGSVEILSRQYYLFDPSTPIRQRVYQFTERRGGWRQRVYDVDIEHDIDDLAAWQEITGCSMRWEANTNGYVGRTNPARCFFEVDALNTRVSISSQAELSEDRLILSDRLVFAGEANGEKSIDESSAVTEFQRMTYYDHEISFRPGSDQEWRRVEPIHAIHDQGGRIGLIEFDSELELRYQLEVIRDGDNVQLSLFDLTRQAVVYETQAKAKEGSLDYTSESLQIRLKPRP